MSANATGKLILDVRGDIAMNSNDMHVQGLKELQAKLQDMESKTSQKALRSALMQSATPMVRKLRAVAPVGTRDHRTYKGRLVAPGFLRRSVGKASKLVRAKNSTIAVVFIGVKKEAYYGPQFLDKGTKFIKGMHWFKHTFDTGSGNILSNFRSKLAAKLRD